MKQFSRYILSTFIVLIGVSWFFQKINKHDFYNRYFRLIEELNVRNSHALNEDTVHIVEYKNVFIKEVYTSTLCIFLSKIGLSTSLSVSDIQYINIHFPSILILLSEKMKDCIPFSLAPPFVLAN